MPEKYSPPPIWEDPNAAGEPIDLLAACNGLIRHWPYIIAMATCGGILGLAISLFLAPEFSSRAVFLPPSERLPSTDNPFAALLKAPSTAIYSGLLLSDTVLSDVVDHCHLQERFKSKDLQTARTKLRQITKVSVDSSGFVTIEVSNRDAKLAQEISSSFLTALERLNDRMAIATATQQRNVYQVELQHEKNELEDAEVNLKRAQESSGVILPQAQTESGLTAIEAMQAQIRLQQVRLTALLQAQTEQAPDVVRTRSQIETLKAQLHQLENGGHISAGEGLIASKAPSVNLEFVRLEREVKYHQALFDAIAKQFENARLEESEAAPGVQIVDYPEIPIHKSWPPRTIFTLTGAVISALVAIIIIFMKNRLDILRGDPKKADALRMFQTAWSQPRLRP